MDQEQLKAWLAAILDDFESKDIFLIDIEWNSSAKKLVVYIDSEHTLPLAQCQAVSRFIEKALDESKLIGLQYALEVSSPGLDRPLVSIRQYPKNIGRVLRIILHDDSQYIGKLIQTSQEGLKIKLEEQKGKKKQKTYGQEREILFNDIKKTFVEIRF